MPTISVILPTYNREKLLAEAVSSVLQQTYTDYELIVVDDGSTDDTKAVLQPFMNRIRYISQENGGVSHARNTGVSAATGKWVAFHDSDNVWLPDKLEKQMNVIRETNSGICFTDFTVREAQGLRTGCEWSALQESCPEWIKIDDPNHVYLYDTPPLSISTMLVRKECLQSVGEFDPTHRVGDDSRMVYNLLTREAAIFLCTPLMVNDRTEERQGLVNDSIETQRVRSELQISLLMSAYPSAAKGERVVFSAIRKRLGYALYLRARIACMDGEYGLARCLAKDAIHFFKGAKILLRSSMIWVLPGLARKLYLSREQGGH